MQRFHVLGVVLLSACAASLTPQERTLRQTFADARRDDAAFAAHFDPTMSRAAVRGLRAAFAREPPPKFEGGREPTCVRAYWGEWVIDHSYYVYLRPVAGGFVITEVASDGGFGEALADVGAFEHRAPAMSEYDRCQAANAAAARR